MGKDAHCSLLDNRGNVAQMSAVSSQKKDLVWFRDLRPHASYHVTCQVLSKSGGIPDLPPKVLATTSSREIWTKRDVAGTLLRWLLVLAGTAGVLTVVARVARGRRFTHVRGLWGRERR